jgi:pimeloyl-ACP methyl ester carboxylesterase
MQQRGKWIVTPALPATSGTRAEAISFDGIPLHYTVYGAGGPTILFIHGWSCHQDFWHGQMDAFGASARVVTLDLAGHGRSRAALAERAWSIGAFARDVETVADALGAQAVTLVGHSLGGAVAIESALRLGSRCRLLLGVDTFTDSAFYERRPADEIAGRRTHFEADFAGALGGMVESITGPDTDPGVTAWIAQAMALTDAAVALAALEALLVWDIEARWPLVRCPVETINSGRLARTGERIALHRLIVHDMEGVGHFPMLENPTAFNTLAHAILARSRHADTAVNPTA